jgi:hypothetical protein
MSTVSVDPRSSLTWLQQQLRGRLLRMRRAMRVRFVVEALARILLVLVAVLALSLLLDWWLELSRIGRAAFALVGLTAIGWVAWRSLIQPLAMAIGPLDVAAAIDRRQTNGQSHIAWRVASVLQLPDHLEQPRGSSPQMIEAAVRENFTALEGVDFRQALSGRHLLWSLSLACVALLIPVGFALAQPAVARLWSQRWLAGSERPWPRSTHIEIVGLQDSRLIVPRGEPATLQVLVSDKDLPTEVVHMRLRSEAGRDETVTFTRFEPGDFRYDLPPLQQPVNVRIWGGDAEAEPFAITPIDRPRIINLTLRATHPRLSEPSVHHFRGEEGTVRLLPQTQAVLELTANVPIAEITVENADSGPGAFERIDETRFVATWTHVGPVQMRITLTSTEAGLVSHPRPVTIGERPDRAPRLSLRHSGVRQRITPTATVPLQITARDDFGVRSVWLDVETPQMGVTDDDSENVPDAAASSSADDAGEDDPGEDERQAGSVGSGGGGNGAVEAAIGSQQTAESRADDPVGTGRTLYGPQDPAIETVIDQTHSVEVGELGLAPGGVMTVQGIADDDCFTERQRTESRKTVFRIVKPEELFKEILLRQQQLRSRLRTQYEAAIELRDNIRTASLPDDIGALLRTHQLIRREIGQVSTALDASALEMRLNKLGGPETWELIETTVLKPLARLHDAEMELQRQGLSSLLTDNPETNDEIVARQQSIVDGLKRILDNMAQWDSFIDVVNQLNTVIKLETRVRQQTEALRAKQVESIFD